MGTTTPRAGLYKPDEDGEVVDVAKINENSDIIDDLIKGKEVTSTTMPANPVTGQVVYQSDTGFSMTWNGTEWVGRPWALERTYAGADYNVGFSPVNPSFDAVRGATPAMGAPADWGLASWTDPQTNANNKLIKLPASGLWEVTVVINLAGARDYLCHLYKTDGTTLKESLSAVGSSASAGAQRFTFLADKGEHVRLQVTTAAAALVQKPPSLVDPTKRYYATYRHLGLGKALE